jgi:hypothetical protein
MLVAFAAFQSRQSLGDLVALVAIGCLGILLRRFDYSRPAFLIGFVLSAQAEAYANMANQIAGARFQRSFMAGIEYIATPVSITILLLTILSIFIGMKQAAHINENADAPTGTKRAPVIFLLCMTAYLLLAWLDALTIHRFGDKVFPVTVGTVTLLACLALLWRMRRKPETDHVFVDLESAGGDAPAPHGLWATLAWFLFLLFLSGMFGFFVALAMFFLTFYRTRAHLSWLRTILFTVGGLAFILFLASVLGRDFPPGLLQRFLDLPWPLT